jgi:SSS family solute:Na+ symporter
MYPHSMTAVLSGKTRDVIRRNASILPAYSLLLGLLALLGFAAIAAETPVFGSDGVANPQLAVPHLFQENFPSWFAGVAFSAIAIGALVPSAIMSIAAANLFTRNIYREYFKPDATHAEEARASKIMSLVVKFGALLFVLGLDKQNAINMQLLGGVWILQTFVSIVAGLFTRWFHRWALLVGWAVGMVYGTWTAYKVEVPNIVTRLVDGEPVPELHGTRHFGGPLAEFPFTNTTVYIGLTTVLINLLVAVALTFVFRALRAPDGTDETTPDDYYSDAPGVALPKAGEFVGEDEEADPAPAGRT